MTLDTLDIYLPYGTLCILTKGLVYRTEWVQQVRKNNKTLRVLVLYGTLYILLRARSSSVGDVSSGRS